MIHAVYFACLQRGYRDGDLSLVYPLARGSGPVLATVARDRAAGRAARRRGARGRRASVVLAILSLAAPAVRAGAPGTGWALATGLTIAVYTLWDKHAVEDARRSPIVYFWATEIGVALVLTPFVAGVRGGARRGRDDLAVDRRPALGVALLSGFAYILVLYALQLAPVSYVAPAREVSVLFGAALGVGVLGEADPRAAAGVRRGDRGGDRRARGGLAAAEGAGARSR